MRKRFYPARRLGKGVWRIEFILERRNNRSKGKMARMCTVLMDWQEMPHDLRMEFLGPNPESL